MLAIRLDDVDGLLLTTPALRALKQQLRARKVTMLTTPAGAQLARHVPEVDDVIACEAADPATADVIATRAFDAAVIFDAQGGGTLPAAGLCERAGIALRLAHSCEEAMRHEVRRHLDLVATIGARPDDEHLSFRVGPSCTGRAKLKLVEAGLELRRPFIVVHPGADASRRWAAERFAAAADQLSTLLDSQVVVTGSATERELAERVRRGAGPRAWSLAGSLTLGELAAVIEAGGLLMSSDPSAVHLASALGTPVVGLHDFAATGHTPWMVAHRVIGSDGEASVEDVVKEACDLWLDIHWRAVA